MSLHVLLADEWLVGVAKPAGMLCVPGRGEDKQDCLWARVRAQYADALVVHRLDMATSGVMVFGRGAAAQRHLGIAFAQRAVRKRYVALVHGRVAMEAGEIDLPLVADWPARPKQKVDTVHGKPSLTRFRRLAIDASANTTRLELEPLTGRSHQLRVHLLALGHPIVGDALYGPDDGAPRLMLHASLLALPHPHDGRPVVLECEVPF